mgnify:CR=1 FL=1
MKANKLRPLVLAVAATWGVSAQAGITWYSPITTFEDDDIDWFLDRAAPEGDNDIGVLNTTPAVCGRLMASPRKRKEISSGLPRAVTALVP